MIAKLRTQGSVKGPNPAKRGMKEAKVKSRFRWSFMRPAKVLTFSFGLLLLLLFFPESCNRHFLARFQGKSHNRRCRCRMPLSWPDPFTEPFAFSCVMSKDAA